MTPGKDPDVDLSLLTEEAERRRVTQRDIAKVCRLHNSTVSLALRACPSIPEDTTQRVLRAAAALGYVRDATSGALASYLAPAYSARMVESVAFAFTRRRSVGLDREACEHSIRQSVEAAGFAYLSLAATSVDDLVSRVNRALTDPRVSGVIVESPASGAALRFVNSPTPLVRVALSAPAVRNAGHGVCVDEEGILRAAVRAMLALEIRRIGVVHVGANPEPIALPDVSLLNSVGTRIRPTFTRILRLAGSSGSHAAPRADLYPTFREWLEDCRPEVILSNSDDVYSWLKRAASPGAPTISFASLDARSASDEIAGVAGNGRALGISAVRMIEALHNGHLAGLSSVSTTLVSGKWRHGASLKPQFFAG